MGSFFSKKWGWYENWVKDIENIWIEWNRLIVLLKAFFYWVRNKSDIYVAHDIDSYLVVVWIKLFRWKSKIVFDSHEYYDEMWKMKQICMAHRLIYFVFSLIIKPITVWLFNWVTVVSDIMLDNYSRWWAKEIVYNFPISGFSGGVKEVEKDFLKDKFILVFQWWLTRVRGIYEYVLILEKLVESIPNIHLLIIWWFNDKAYEKQVLDYVDSSGLKDYVTFTWRIPLEEVYAYDMLSNIWLNMLESNFNNDYWIQLKMFEYLYLELPSIWTNNAKYYKEFIVKNWCGEVVEKVDNIEQWAEAIIKMKSNYDFYKLNCKSNKSKYVWKGEEEKLLKFYEEIINEK